MTKRRRTCPDLGALIVRAVGRGRARPRRPSAFSIVMQGRATPVQIAALLVALRARGESPAEVAGGVRALRGHGARAGRGSGFPRRHVRHRRRRADHVQHLHGGGVRRRGAGVRIAKHGNRSFTSRCGSADILEALGVRIELSPDGMATCSRRAGLVFMFAPLLHPAMRHVAPVRRELRMPTVMNLLGPLTNPAGARRQVVGVADPSHMELIAGALQSSATCAPSSSTASPASTS
jgi:anthranilate phosphoribosyltransferase